MTQIPVSAAGPARSAAGLSIALSAALWGAGCSPAQESRDAHSKPSCSDEVSICADRCSRDPAETATGFCDETTCECITEIIAECSDGWCRVPAVSFRMGRDRHVVEWSEYPPHTVVLTRSYYLQETEVTLAAWREVMGEGDDTGFDCGLDCPVTHLTFFDALEFINRMSDRDGLERCYELSDCDDRHPVGRECDAVTFAGPDCLGYRLPSEAEWEAAAGLGLGACFPGHPYVPATDRHADLSCTAPVEPPYPMRDCINSEVDYAGCLNLTGWKGPACSGPGPVKEYPPNPLGLYGMHGNMLELTGTRYRWPLQLPAPPFELEAAFDPGFDREVITGFRSSNPEDGLRAVVTKGGSFITVPFGCCSYSRGRRGLGRLNGRVENAGFRLARTAPK